MEYIENIVRNILISLYQLLGASVLVAVLFMFLYMYMEESDWKKAFGTWIDKFRNEKEFRQVFFLSLYTAMILFKTVFARSIWEKPLSDIFGGWGINDSKGVLATENIENVMLFIPFTILVLVVKKYKATNEIVKITFIKSIVTAAKVAFVTSGVIEVSQLLLKVGTLQVSDLVYNTLGGIIGGIIYYIASKIKNE